ncbi:death-associated protein 1-like [Uloborus diversus]|uniref:death-associated protein 1-like n=1 Tax=Uloborus diversus TaxID=327109 RepID=UPI00240A6F39|nr:death-associated protein 1-like [Uloborus diversus]
MSSPESSSELKGGHPPAVKAGGMRITQHKVPSHEKPVEVKKTEGEEEEEEVVTPSPPKQQLVISGVPARGDADFPTEAVQAFHNKPIPSHDYRSSGGKPNIIHQPRK